MEMLNSATSERNLLLRCLVIETFRLENKISGHRNIIFNRKNNIEYKSSIKLYSPVNNIYIFSWKIFSSDFWPLKLRFLTL